MAENKLGQLKTRKGWRYYWEPCPKSAISYWGEGACTVKSVVFCLTPSKPPQGLVLHYINVKHSQTKSKTGSESSWRKKNTYSINKLSILPPSQTPPGLAKDHTFTGCFLGTLPWNFSFIFQKFAPYQQLILSFHYLHSTEFHVICCMMDWQHIKDEAT